MNEETKGQGFVIKDKRHTHKSDEEIKEADQARADEEAKAKDAAEKRIPDDFQIDFSTFVLSLTSSAFYHLGDIPDPQTGEKKTDLSAVKQTIDILSMLKEKTQGNLNKEEEKLLHQLTYELQMKFVSAQSK
ncbi:MAG: DUF1844 domain-containing protein [Nitrospinales bacterium]